MQSQNNSNILSSLEHQRNLFREELLSKSISEQYQERFEDLEQGLTLVIGMDEGEMLLELSALKDDTSSYQ